MLIGIFTEQNDNKRALTGRAQAAKETATMQENGNLAVLVVDPNQGLFHFRLDPLPTGP